MTDEDLALSQWDTDGGAQAPDDNDDEEVVCQLWWRDC